MDKKKIIIILGVIIIIMAIMFLNYVNKKPIKHEENNVIYAINLELYGSYLVETKRAIEFCNLDLAEDAPFTFFYQTFSFKDLYDFALERLDIDLSEYNNLSLNAHSNKYVAMTIGRKLESINYRQHEGYGKPFAEITFFEEYHDKTMFIYLMDNLTLFPSILAGGSPTFGPYNSFYIMKKEERVFYSNDIFDLNSSLEPIKSPEMVNVPIEPTPEPDESLEELPLPTDTKVIENSDINIDGDILAFELYDIKKVAGEAGDYNLTYQYEEASEIMFEKLGLQGGFSTENKGFIALEDVGFFITEALYTINNIGYFYFHECYLKVGWGGPDTISFVGNFYINGYTGEVYFMEARTDARTYFTLIE
jgi:hypothetical protein